MMFLMRTKWHRIYYFATKTLVFKGKELEERKLNRDLQFSFHHTWLVTKITSALRWKVYEGQCFKMIFRNSQNVPKLLVVYYVQCLVWQAIFTKDGFRNIHSCFSAEKRKVLLIKDNCTAHISRLQVIRVEYF